MQADMQTDMQTDIQTDKVKIIVWRVRPMSVLICILIKNCETEFQSVSSYTWGDLILGWRFSLYSISVMHAVLFHPYSVTNTL